LNSYTIFDGIILHVTSPKWEDRLQKFRNLNLLTETRKIFTWNCTCKWTLKFIHITSQNNKT